jgi:hypothetical protein
MNNFDSALKRDSAPECKELMFLPQDIEKLRLTLRAPVLF